MEVGNMIDFPPQNNVYRNAFADIKLQSVCAEYPWEGNRISGSRFSQYLASTRFMFYIPSILQHFILSLALSDVSELNCRPPYFAPHVSHL